MRHRSGMTPEPITSLRSVERGASLPGGAARLLAETDFDVVPSALSGAER
jgi:hypothetical protein